MRRSGLALLIVVGVLGILAVLGVAFVTMAHLERKASLQRLHATKAQLLARSGIEDALARFDAGQDPEGVGSAYGGENWDGSADGLLSALEAGQEVYRSTGAGTQADVDACPASQAMRPSFFVRQSSLSPDPALASVDGRQRGYSGRLQGAQAAGGNLYVLKVKTGGIHVNGGDPAAAPNVGYNPTLRRILGTLAREVSLHFGLQVMFGTPLMQDADGWALVDVRSALGRPWRSWEEIRDLALGGSQAKLDALKPYLTLHAWVDSRVIRPNAVPAMQGFKARSWAEIKGFGGRGAPVLEPRAPVSLPWARSRRPVLLALFENLKGFSLREDGVTGAAQEDQGDWVGSLWNLGILPEMGDPLISSTSDLDTWEAWDAFWDAAGLSEIQTSIVKANFNPNSNLNKFNPNPSHWKPVDKQDLQVYSTEFSLQSLDPCEVESVGRVTDAGGRLLASREVRALVAGPSVVRLSTQREFVCRDLGSLDRAGDEQGFRLPGAYLSFNAGLTETWGAKIPSVAGKGVTLQSYPEPYADPGTGLQVNPADYDGSLQLATVETAANQFYGVSSPVQDMKMLACYDDSLDLESPGTDVPGPNLPDTAQVSTAELGLGLLDPVKQNTLYPDGVYSEKDRTPSYHDAGNAHGHRGLMSFWLKPNYVSLKCMPNVSARFRGRRFVAWTNYVEAGTGNGVGSANMLFALAETKKSPTIFDSAKLTWFFENGHEPDDTGVEHKFVVNQRSLPHRWELVTCYWDFLYPAPPDEHVAEMVWNDGSAIPGGASASTYPGGTGNNPVLAADITEPDLFGPHRIWLGPNHVPEFEVSTRLGSGADATFDEFAIYDLGALGNTDAVETRKFAKARYADGRYYKESAYAGFGAPANANKAARYLSPLINLGGASRIRSLAWTQVVPRGLRSPLPAGGQAGVDGDPGADGRIVLELADAAGTGYLQDSAGQPINRTFSDPGGSPVARVVASPFRLHAVFQPNLAVLGNTPILDPLALDDVTVVYEPLNGRRLLAWEPGK